MKKIIAYCLICFSFLFAQEIIVVNSEEEFEKQSLALYKEIQNLSVEYLQTQNNEILKEYALKSKEFYTAEKYMSSFQPYVIAESLYYWNFLKNSITDEQIVKGIDKNVIDLWNYLNKSKKIYDNSYLVFSYYENLKNIYSKYSTKESFLPVNIDISKITKQTSVIELVQDEKYKNYLLNTISLADSLLEKISEKGNSLSKIQFTAISNQPNVLYLVLTQNKYELIKQQYVSICSSLSGIQKSDIDKIIEDTYSNNNFFRNNIYFSKSFIDIIYSALPDEQLSSDVKTVYNFSYLLNELYIKSLSVGVLIENIFTNDKAKLFLELIENPLKINCVDLEIITDLTEQLKLLNNIYSKEQIVLLNNN